MNLVAVAREALREELRAAWIYSRLAERSRGRLSEKLRSIAEMEERHADFWRKILEARGEKAETGMGRAWPALMSAASRLLGASLMIRMLESGEGDAIRMYSELLESPELTEKEREELRSILEDELLHESELADEESRVKELLDYVRDALLGMNDGLVEVLSVTMGLVGAYGNPMYVALGGMIVGAAGALSMGLGALVSTRAQREVRMSVLSRFLAAAKYVGGALAKRLAGMLEEKGFSRDVAVSVAEAAARNPELLGRMAAAEEHGVIEERIESPGKAAFYTGMFYLLGAAIPVAPYAMGLPLPVSAPLSLIAASATLGLAGFFVALSAGLSPLRKALELVVVGLGAAAITFAIGKLASVLLGVELA